MSLEQPKSYYKYVLETKDKLIAGKEIYTLNDLVFDIKRIENNTPFVLEFKGNDGELFKIEPRRSVKCFHYFAPCDSVFMKLTLNLSGEKRGFDNDEDSRIVFHGFPTMTREGEYPHDIIIGLGVYRSSEGTLRKLDLDDTQLLKYYKGYANC